MSIYRRGLLRLVARGMSPEDARGTRLIESVVADLRFALRYLKHKPLTSTTIVLVLALGIGVNSALVSMIQAVTTRPAPAVPRDDRHVRIYTAEQPTRGAPWQRRGMTYGELRALAARTETFTAVAGYTTDDVILGGTEVGTRDARAQFVTADYFATVGVSLRAGHGLRAADDDVAAAMDVIISHTLWEELFSKSDTAIGQLLRLNHVDVRVAGVAPPRFQGPLPTRAPTMLWLPISARAAIVNSSPGWLASPDSALFTAFGGLAPGVTTDQATATARDIAMAALARRTATKTSDARWSAEVVGIRDRPTMMERDPSLVLMLGGMGVAALLVLLVACTNVSSLLVAAAVGRRHEIAVRLSLGASRARIVRQLVTETTLLAVAGGLAGLLIYWWLIRIIAAHVVDNIDLAPDAGTLWFTVLFAIGTGILFGLSPALHATRDGIATAIRDAGGGFTRRSKLQGGFVIAQIALTQPLLVVIAMLLSVVIADEQAFPDERVGSRVVAARFRITGGANSGTARRARVRELMERVSREPGVTAVVPESDEIAMQNLMVVHEDRGTGVQAGEAIRVIMEGAAPGYLPMLRVPILRGRDLQLADTAGREIAALLPSDVARAFWGETDPLGRRLERVVSGRDTSDRRNWVVVGVYDATKPTTRRVGRRVYVADSSRWRPNMFLARTSGPAEAFVPRLNKLLRDEAPDLPVIAVETVNDMREESREEAWTLTSMVLAIGGLALLLASIGLYGVVSLAVGQRRREIGVRIALGGKPLRVAGMFFASGVRLSVLGLLLGLPLCIVGLKLASSSFAGKGTAFNLPLIAGGIAAVVVAVASLATWLPARRAASVDPAVALRDE